MAEEYDIVFIGAGHNALTCAAYLARAGAKVAIFEQYEKIGGGAMTRPITGVPGFNHNTHSQQHNFIFAGPTLDDLELYTRFGLRYVQPKGPTYATVFADGKSIVLYQDDIDRSCEEIAKFSRNDARRYKEHCEQFKGIRDLMASLFYVPPSRLSDVFATMEQSEEGRDLLRLMLSSPKHVADELFETDEVKVHVLWAATQTGQTMYERTFGMMVPEILTVQHYISWGICVGGSNNLAQSIGRAVEAYGGVIKTKTLVTRVLVENGRATGVQLADGTVVKARKAVVSSAGAPQLVMKLLGSEFVEPTTIRKAEKFHWDEQVLVTPHLALKQAPHWKAAERNPDVDKCWNVAWGCENMDEFASQFSDLREHVLPRHPGGMTCTASLWDKELAPPGNHVTFYWQFTCYDLYGDSSNWVKKEVQDEIWDKFLGKWREYCPNLTDDNILGRALYTPHEIPINNPSMHRASMMLGDAGLEQMFFLRPWDSFADYRLKEVKGVYECSSTMHPVGSICAGPGYNAAEAVADDLGLTKWWKKE